MVGSMGQEEVGSRVKGDKLIEVYLLDCYLYLYGHSSWVVVLDSTFHPFSKFFI